MSFESLRLRVLFKAEANAFLIFHPQISPDGNELANGAQVVVYADHLATDGIGVRILLGKYLALLAEILQGGVRKETDWTRGKENLSRP